MVPTPVGEALRVPKMLRRFDTPTADKLEYMCISRITIWVFPKIGVPQNGWFIMDTPIEMDDLGVPPF